MSKIQMCVEFKPRDMHNEAMEDSLVAPTPKTLKWRNGQIIRVKFLDGTDFVKSKVEQYAQVWEEYVNIKFDFGNHEEAEIRISFKLSGSWSYLGKHCLSISDQTIPTMNYGWFDENTQDEEFRRTTLHEFGHALGFGHEHLNPEVDIPWDKEKVYDYYMGPPNNWTKEMIDYNIFNRYEPKEAVFSPFDDKSIMLYAIPNELTIGEYQVGWNTNLSEMDKEFASQYYPKVVETTH
ncbi:M12 family metallopeptidase [Paenibacillus sp. FSL H8-0317]|uniref:M12 family metallopeptidase n=1 Tax=Paenibacillus sp. FSL H8-0317 TaxID=2921385 RepID=UPI00325669DC